MPDIDGFTVCERIRDYVSCPIIFLTARIEDSDKIKGFSIGADDYVIKPFSVDELEARIAAHLRREKRHNTSSKVQFDEDMVIDYSSRIVFYHNKDNSIRYAKSDIAISVVIENNNLVISVSDDGCGFKNIEIEKATLPFYKSSKDISTEHLGLGLNISKILSERHGGNIQIANNKAGGACVTVKINCNES